MTPNRCAIRSGVRGANSRVGGRWATRERSSGQATVELVALLPLIAGVVLVVAQLLATGVARELAGHAAHAGAVAVLQGEDPEEAARDAVPGWSRDRVDVRVRGGEVSVRLRPFSPLAPVADMLAVTRTADAGDIEGSRRADPGSPRRAATEVGR